MLTLKLRFVLLLTLSLQTGAVFAYCVESGSDGALTDGVMSQGECEGLLDNLTSDTKKHGKNIELFIAQENEGYYYKVCNSPEMKEHFKENFDIASIQPTCTTVCQSAEQLAGQFCGDGKSGIRSFQYLGQGKDCLKVKICNFKK